MRITGDGAAVAFGAADGFIFEGIDAHFEGFFPGGGEGGVGVASGIDGEAREVAGFCGAGDVAGLGEGVEEPGFFLFGC